MIFFYSWFLHENLTVFIGKSKSSNVSVKAVRFFYKNRQKPLNFPIYTGRLKKKVKFSWKSCKRFLWFYDFLKKTFQFFLKNHKVFLKKLKTFPAILQFFEGSQPICKWKFKICTWNLTVFTRESKLSNVHIKTVRFFYKNRHIFMWKPLHFSI